MSVREVVWQELQGLNEEKLRLVSEFVAFLNFREKFKPSEDDFVNTLRDDEVRSPVMTDVEKEKYLEELLAGVTEENLHPEFNTGPSVGKEAW
jgi:hypothetical protein